MIGLGIAQIEVDSPKTKARNKSGSDSEYESPNPDKLFHCQFIGKHIGKTNISTRTTQAGSTHNSRQIWNTYQRVQSLTRRVRQKYISDIVGAKNWRKI